LSADSSPPLHTDGTHEHAYDHTHPPAQLTEYLLDVTLAPDGVSIPFEDDLVLDVVRAEVRVPTGRLLEVDHVGVDYLADEEVEVKVIL
jgi:hypothetical protein